MAATGMAVAYGSDALDATPSYTDLLTTDGVSVQSFQTRRGRSYLTNRTDAGTGQMDFSDQAGVLDPTNAAGPFFPMDPNRPAAICLYNPVAATWAPLLTGLVQSIPTTVYDGGKRNTGSIMLADLFSLLARKEVPPGLDFDDTAMGTSTTNTSGDTTYAATDVQTRLKALAADAGIPAGLTNFFTGNVDQPLTVYSPGYTILAAMQDCAEAEYPGVANLFVGKDGVLNFRGRLARFNPTDPMYNINTWNVGDAAAAAAHSSWAVLTSLKFDRDIGNIYNNALFTPQGILNADIAGQLSVDGASVTQFGNRGISGLDLKNAGATSGALAGDANGETAMFGTFYTDNFAGAQTRVAQATFRIKDPADHNGTAQWLFLCGVELSDVVNITTSHVGGGGFSAEPYFVEGIRYQGVLGKTGMWDLTMTLDLSPGAYYTTEPDNWSPT